MPFVFSHVEYCDIYFVYGFCDGNVRAGVQEYHRRFPDRRIPSRSVFTRIQQTLRDTGSLPSVSVHSEREDVRLNNTRENDSREALRDHIFAAAEHIRHHPGNIASATQSLLMRAENCITAGGGHFEQLL
jgi:hypothetical protein